MRLLDHVLPVLCLLPLGILPLFCHERLTGVISRDFFLFPEERYVPVHAFSFVFFRAKIGRKE